MLVSFLMSPGYFLVGIFFFSFLLFPTSNYNVHAFMTVFFGGLRRCEFPTYSCKSVAVRPVGNVVRCIYNPQTGGNLAAQLSWSSGQVNQNLSTALARSKNVQFFLSD